MNLTIKNRVSRINTTIKITIALLVVLGAQAVSAKEAISKINSAKFDTHKPIPHSTIAEAEGRGIVKAMLSCATGRYAHGVLGDAIEAGCLIVEDDSQQVYQLDLPDHQVFEDLIPRIADINGDKRNDVVLVRSEQQQGAALTIYTLEQSASATSLKELAATPPIGTGNRWLAPVGIADFNNDGNADIAYIQTPHIGGILKVWSIIDNDFQQIAQSRGFSNHRIGSTRVSTAKLADYNEDGVTDMALPNQRRSNAVWVTLYPEFTVLDVKPYSAVFSE